MSILVTCECGKRFEVGDEYAGRRGRCPNCGLEAIIPQRGSSPGQDARPRADGSPYSPPKAGLAADDALGDLAAGPQRTSGKAVTSLVLGLSSVFCLLNLLTGIPAIIFGCLGLGDIKRGKGQVKGQGMAITGIVTGSLACGMLPILAVLIALLLPAVQAAREAARRAQCVNNLKQIGLAMYNFSDANGHFPPAAITDAEGKPLLSWRVAILPYIEQTALYNQFNLSEPWDSAHNQALIAKMPRTYACPSDPPAIPATTRYQVFVGPGTLFEGPKGITINEITDGTSNTLMVVEAKDPVAWTKPEDLTYAPTAPLPMLGSHHAGGENASFADGSVRFLKNASLPSILQALITRNGGEVLPVGQE